MPIDTLPLHVRVRLERRDADLERLGFQGYNAYLSSPHWLDVRRAFQESDQPQRCMCGSDEVQLHHRTYERLGAENPTDLMALCRNCHSMVHELERRGEMGLDFSGFEDPQRALRYRLENHGRIQRAQDEAPPELTERVGEAKRARNRWRKEKQRAARRKP